MGDQVIKQGSIQANVPPELLNVPLSGAKVLTLRVTVHEAVGDTSTVVWGNARVS